MTTTYWSIGCRIVEREQQGAARARYGEGLVRRLSRDLSERFGRGFGRRNLFQKVQTASALFIPESPAPVGRSFPLPWSHYVRLLSVRNPEANPAQRRSVSPQRGRLRTIAGCYGGY